MRNRTADTSVPARVLLTGGAGFIGSHTVRYLVREVGCHVLNVDKLTYAGNPESLADVEGAERYSFSHTDICDSQAIRELFLSYRPDAVLHLAAESHVDRSIDSPDAFLQTNVLGTAQLLDAALEYWRSLDDKNRKNFRFLHVSTDEVYGDLKPSDEAFVETSRYAPSSPYAATKAGSDHLVRAWGRTYGLPVLVSNCSNNYGPYQFPEKLIPHMILNALCGKSLPIYGDGQQLRDWLYVEDHSRALWTVLTRGRVGETYNVGGHNEEANIDVVRSICKILAQAVLNSDDSSEYENLITFVSDRPGHDIRYAIDASKIERDLGWRPIETFETGLAKTVQWYVDNRAWWQRVLDGSYRLQRLGNAGAAG